MTESHQAQVIGGTTNNHKVAVDGAWKNSTSKTLRRKINISDGATEEGFLIMNTVLAEQPDDCDEDLKACDAGMHCKHWHEWESCCSCGLNDDDDLQDCIHIENDPECECNICEDTL